MMKAFVVFFVCLPVAYGFILECEFSTKTWPRLEKVYTCDVKVLDMEQVLGNALTNITGKHAKDKKNSDVQFLNVNQTLPFIPLNISTFFKNLKGIQWWHSELQTISAIDLNQFPGLQTFSVYGNELTTIDGNLFDFTRKLKLIDFRYNLIEQVGASLLNNLSDLKEVNFIGNRCINVHADSSKKIKELINELPINCAVNTSTKPSITEPSTAEPTITETHPSTTSEPKVSESPVTNAPPTECPDECLTRIDQKFIEVVQVADELVTEIESLRLKVAQLSLANANYEARFVEIEKQLREMDSSPCSPSSCPP